MGINRVEINRNGQAETLIDISNSTIEADKMLNGTMGYGADGEPVTGSIETFDGGYECSGDSTGGDYEYGYADGYETGNADGYTRGYEDGMKNGGESEDMYELLDTITLTEETSKLVINKYADGSPMNLKKAYVILHLPTLTKTFWVSMHVNSEYYKYIGGTFGNTSYNTYYDFEAVIDAGLLRLGYAYHTNSTHNAGTWNTVTRKLVEKISSLIFTPSSGYVFPIGTSFEVYGVKN